jgi:hypothetical protein
MRTEAYVLTCRKVSSPDLTKGHKNIRRPQSRGRYRGLVNATMSFRISKKVSFLNSFEPHLRESSDSRRQPRQRLGKEVTYMKHL